MTSYKATPSSQDFWPPQSVGRLPPRGDNWVELRTAPALLKELKDKTCRRMTVEEQFEQRVSFIFSTQDGMTKDQVRAALREG